MKDERIERVAKDITEVLRQWFAEQQTGESVHEGTLTDENKQDSNQGDLDILLHEASSALDAALICLEKTLTLLRHSPTCESGRRQVVVLRDQIVQLQAKMEAFCTLYQLEDSQTKAGQRG